MAVASDLPALETARRSTAPPRTPCSTPTGPDCSSRSGECPQIAKLTGNQNRILVTEGEISPNIKNAVIAIEDKRFYKHEGVDYRASRARSGRTSCASRPPRAARRSPSSSSRTRSSAQGDRSVFQKLREAALAYHLERKWSKEKILTQYLNTVYFGNGAYGVESAARTYFGDGDEPTSRDRHARRRPSADDHVATADARASPGRGRAARRDDRLALDVRPGAAPGRGAASAATWCCRACATRR